MNQERVATILRERIVPQPMESEFPAGEPFRLVSGCRLILSTPYPAPELTELVNRLCLENWGIDPAIVPETGPFDLPAGGYELDVDSGRIELRAADAAGIRHAFATLRQLAEPVSAVPSYAGDILAPARVWDWPSTGFRGVHLCWFPETRAFEIERMIRLAACYKFNAVVIEPWGVFPFDSHPEIGWPEHRVDRDEFARLIRVGRELGLEMIPQLNLLGHGSGARVLSGKHMLLDRHPELRVLQEPDGWSWCLSNPATRSLLRDLVLELYDFFGSPAYFHLGCDEAYNLGSCASCRSRDLEELVLEHLTFFRNLLAERNCRAIIWHDMLLRKDDPRWKGYTACGTREDGLENLYRSLPRDLIIADWQYGAPPDEERPVWPTAKFFKEAGFDVVVCPWINENGTLSLGAMAAREKLAGVLATSWHKCSGINLFKIFFFGAQAAWNGSYSGLREWSGAVQQFNRHLRQIAWEQGREAYPETGSCTAQLPEETLPD